MIQDVGKINFINLPHIDPNSTRKIFFFHRFSPLELTFPHNTTKPSRRKKGRKTNLKTVVVKHSPTHTSTRVAGWRLCSALQFRTPPADRAQQTAKNSFTFTIIFFFSVCRSSGLALFIFVKFVMYGCKQKLVIEGLPGRSQKSSMYCWSRLKVQLLIR